MIPSNLVHIHPAPFLESLKALTLRITPQRMISLVGRELPPKTLPKWSNLCMPAAGITAVPSVVLGLLIW
uniref:Uncharacterized protein n=1 Tax=Arundo donax TaxID=35708 RepID=A0A0A9EXK5_ARUDO